MREARGCSVQRRVGVVSGNFIKNSRTCGVDDGRPTLSATRAGMQTRVSIFKNPLAWLFRVLVDRHKTFVSSTGTVCSSILTLS